MAIDGSREYFSLRQSRPEDRSGSLLKPIIGFSLDVTSLAPKRNVPSPPEVTTKSAHSTNSLQYAVL